MVSENGDLWETGPVVGWMVFEYVEDPKNIRSPTQVCNLIMVNVLRVTIYGMNERYSKYIQCI